MNAYERRDKAGQVNVRPVGVRRFKEGSFSADSFTTTDKRTVDLYGVYLDSVVILGARAGLDEARANEDINQDLMDFLWVTGGEARA
jgi:hypothetical protein